jgi:hypothetical protein
VKYVKVDGLAYEMRRFEQAYLRELFEANVVALNKQEKTLFSHIVIDSDSGPEKVSRRLARITMMFISTSNFWHVFR